MLQQKFNQKPHNSDQQRLKEIEVYVTTIKKCLQNSKELAEKAREEANRVLDDIARDINHSSNGL